MSNTRRKFLVNLSLATAGLSIPGVPKGTFGSLTTNAAIGREEELSNLIEIDISEVDFSNVPNSARPWVYYWWLKGNVTKELITRDLEAMKAKGIGGFLLFDSRAYHDGYYDGIIPVPLHIKLAFMSPQWLEMVHFTMQEAERLGLKMSVNIANSGGALRGPWDFEEQGPKKLIWTAVSFNGPTSVDIILKAPEDKKYYQEVALIAVQLEDSNIELKYSDNLNENWNNIITPSDDTPVIKGQVLDLGTHLENNRLKWKVPKGRWLIIRFGTSVIGEKGDVDILNEEVVKKYFALIGDNILKKTKQLNGKVLTHMYNVSWEGENPDWTTDFEKEFMKYRGYDIKSYMIMFTGIALNNRIVYKKFMRDYYRTLSDCFKNNCYETIGKLCHENGIEWHSENGGPWRRFAPMLREADQLDFWGTNDMPQGEFWCSKRPDSDKRSNARYVSMAAHTYGKPLVAVESFTSMSYHWTHYPGFLKPFADINLIDGANFFIWHTFTASPLDIGKPGYEYFAGTHINPNVTWFDKVEPFIKYLGRCQYLLRMGQYVTDICCYVSDKNYVKWGRAKKWNEESSLFLESGYCYDLLNTDILINNLIFKDGKFALSSGMKYSLLVVDLESREIPLAALKKIIQLIKEGAPIVLGNTVPKYIPGLKNYPESDSDVTSLAKQLWKQNSKGKNLHNDKVYRNATMKEILKENNILPDFQGPFEYIHKKDDQKDIYFLTGQGSGECIFRVDGKRPEIWDPLSGKVNEIFNYKTTRDARTIIPIDLPENGSTFIIFRGKPHKNHFTSITGSGTPQLIRQQDASIKVTSWENGEYIMVDTKNRQQKIVIQVEEPVKLTGPWELTFQPAVGGDHIKKPFKDLMLWNDHKDPEIKYFSGNVLYKITFELNRDQIQNTARLKLGQVFDIAQVWINNKDMGIVWTHPWSIELSDVLTEGLNQLEIEVTNCWRNRLIGDAGLPEDKRKTQTNVRLVADRSIYKNSYEAYSADDPLSPSGLLGPVFIEFGKSKLIEKFDYYQT